MSTQTLDCLLARLEQGYSKYANPYHNMIHAADVTQTMHHVISRSGLSVGRPTYMYITGSIYYQHHCSHKSCRWWKSGQLGVIHLWCPQEIRFLTTPVHTRPDGPDPPSPLWTSTRGRYEIHTALLKWLVWWPTGPKAKIRLYDSNLFKLYY